MDFELSDTQALLKDSIDRFLAEQYDFTTRRQIVAEEPGMSRIIWRGFAELGVLGLTLPESVGGLGAGPVERLTLMEALGRALVVEPYLPAIVLSAEAVAKLGTPQQRSAVLPAVVAGDQLLAFAHGESGHTGERGALTTAARRIGGAWELDGVKRTVLGAPWADQLVVSAAIQATDTESAGVGLFLVPRVAAGVTLDGYPVIDGTRAADLTLRRVAVPDDAWLGQSRDAGPVIEALLDGAIAALAADALGVIDALIEATRSHCRTRVQYGQPIGKFQVLQHRLADMAVLREEARSLTILAALAADGHPVRRQRASSAAKIKVGRAAKLVAEHAVQIHGAMGVTEELNIGAYLKRALVFNLLFGSVDEHLQRYASLVRTHELLGESLVEDTSHAAEAVAPQREARA